MLITANSPSAVNAVDQEAPEGYVYVEVETGVSDDSYTQVLSGLQEGDTVAYLQTAGSASSDGMAFVVPSGDMPSVPMGDMPSGCPPAAECPAADPEEASDGPFDRIPGGLQDLSDGRHH